MAGQIAQLIASIVGPALGLPFPYEMAPEDGSVPAALVTQINLMFWLASILMLALAFLLGWLLKVRGPRNGLTRGAIWATVVGLSQAVLGLGQGTVNVMGLLGTWAYLLAIVLGPVLAGLVGGRRAA